MTQRPLTEDEYERLFADATRFAERHLGDPLLNLGLIAEALHASPARVNRAFQHAAGTTFPAWLFDRRMRRARELLERGEPARRAAGYVGYGSGAALAKAFRRRYGIAPHEVWMEPDR